MYESCRYVNHVFQTSDFEKGPMIASGNIARHEELLLWQLVIKDTDLSQDQKGERNRDEVQELEGRTWN